jgi:hypothetical protein
MGIAMSVPCLITAVQATIQERPLRPQSGLERLMGSSAVRNGAWTGYDEFGRYAADNRGGL